MKTLQYSVVVLPKLDNQEQIQQLREKYDPWFYQIRPYIPLVPPFTPSTLGELESVSSYISEARRKLHPVAITTFECVEAGDSLLCPIQNGNAELKQLHQSLHGCQAVSLVDEAAYEPYLVVGRVQDPESRARALEDANKLGRTLGIVDAVSLIAIEQDGGLKLVASYPFGVGRVDYYDNILP